MNNQMIFEFAAEVIGIKGRAPAKGYSAGNEIRKRAAERIKVGVLLLASDTKRLPTVTRKKTRRERATAKQHEINKIFSRLLSEVRKISDDIDKGVSAEHTLDQTHAALIEILGIHFCKETAALYLSLGGLLSRNSHEIRHTFGCPPMD